MTFLLNWLTELWFILAESGVWLVGGFLLAGVVHVLLPQDLIARALGGRGPGALLRAALVGVPLPLCSCSVIPVAAGLRRDGASKGASAAFAISTPESGADSIAYTYAVLGPVMAITRPLAALVTAFGAGALIAVTTSDDPPARAEDDEKQTSCCAHKPVPAPSGCCAHTAQTPKDPPPAAGCCTQHSRTRGGRTTLARTKEAVHYGWVEMPRDLAGWLLVGLALSALISVLMPEDFLARRVGTGIGPMLLMLVAGMPVYVCATASTPVAAALVAKGLSPGAALVFLLAGPATNMATMAWVAKDLGWRALVSYLAAIAGCSVAFGLALDALIARGVVGDMTATFSAMTNGHEHGPGVVSVVFGVALCVMLGAALLARVQHLPVLSRWFRREPSA